MAFLLKLPFFFLLLPFLLGATYKDFSSLKLDEPKVGSKISLMVRGCKLAELDWIEAVNFKDSKKILSKYIGEKKSGKGKRWAVGCKLGMDNVVFLSSKKEAKRMSKQISDLLDNVKVPCTFTGFPMGDVLVCTNTN